MKRIIASLALLLVAPLLTAAKCDGKKNCPGTKAQVAAVAQAAPPGECDFLPAPSFSPASLLYGDGVYEVGKDMPAGTWESVLVPAEQPKCVWFVTANPSKDPNEQNTPSYITYKDQYHRILLFLERGQGFVTDKCGQWKFMGPLTTPPPDAR